MQTYLELINNQKFEFFKRYMLHVLIYTYKRLQKTDKLNIQD